MASYRTGTGNIILIFETTVPGNRYGTTQKTLSGKTQNKSLIFQFTGNSLIVYGGTGTGAHTYIKV